MTMPADLDEAMAMLGAKEAALTTAISRCEAEQAAGRTGYDAYVKAKAALEDFNQFAAMLEPRVRQALDSL